MKVHLIRKKTIEDYAEGNAQSRTPFTEWLEKIRHADWAKAGDMKATFPSTDILGKVPIGLSSILEVIITD